MTPTIMVVENEAASALLMEELLTHEGYATLVWLHAEGAVAYIRQELPDVVILDLWIEQQDAGWTVLDQLQNDPATARFPLIVCSGDMQALQAQATLLCNLRCQVVEKPFELQNLRAKVRQSLAPPWTARNRSPPDVVRPMMPPLVFSASYEQDVAQWVMEAALARPESTAGRRSPA